MPTPSIPELVPLAVLGRGAYSKILQVQDKENGEIYAMKVLRKTAIDTSKQDKEGGGGGAGEKEAAKNAGHINDHIMREQMFRFCSQPYATHSLTHSCQSPQRIDSIWIA